MLKDAKKGVSDEHDFKKELEAENKKSRERIDKTFEKANKAIEKSRSAASRSDPVGTGLGTGITNAAQGISNNKVKLFFFIIIGLHLFDLFSGFNRIGGNGIWWATIYLFMALAAPFFLDDGEGYIKTLLSPKTLIFLGISVVAWLLPVLVSKLPAIVQNNMWFKFLIIISPVWLMFLIFSGAQDNLINKIRTVWILIWITLALITLLATVAKWHAPTELQGQFGFNPFDVFSDVWDSVRTSVKKTFSRITGVPSTFGAFINRNLNDSIGRNFAGQVDPYAQGDLGVRFTKIETFRDTFRTGTPITAWAYLQGESFKEELELVMRCFAVSDEGEQFNGTIMTQGVQQDHIHLKMKEKISASCEFDSLPKGYYDIWFGGAFVFETWGYIQYYFAPDELVTNMWLQDLNPAREANIPERPVSIFTSGPINLGLASEQDQPIPINPVSGEGYTPDRTLPPFGASVINQWSDGKVNSVRQITLMIPEPFILKGCDKVPTQGTKQEPQAISDRVPGYREYTFGNMQDVNSGFQSVMCFLAFDEPKEENAANIIASYDLVMKTFAAKTNYVYEIKDSVRVKVE